ncbi:MAG TPA: nucleotide exchange factor GrpE [Isosphaeraceae bacterium]|jgi:molecular chaperone GrpE|nr:nucleotide exchange factor GrpE [Isosphaeraceae bacterium]
MSDAAFPEDQAPTPEGPPEIVPEVAYVVPAAEYVAVATTAAEGSGDGGQGPGVEEVREPDSTPAVVPIAQATPPPAESPRALEAIEAIGKALGKRLDQLQTLFERELRAEATRERVVDRLHAELQEYKQDLLLKILRPVFVDLIQLHDDIGKMAASAGEDAAGLLVSLQQGVEDILYRQGVEPFALDEPTFDPRRQRAVAAVPTEDPALNKAIATRHRKGFQAGDKVIRPEVVSVYSVKK